MKQLIYLLTILMFFFQTGRALSNNNILNVDNIEIDNNLYKNKDALLNKAFRVGFNKLINRILLISDKKKIEKISVNEIKDLISYYQVISENQSNSLGKTKVNIFFDRDRINFFLLDKNIKYADISNIEMIILPIFIAENNFYLYEDNYFYKNWNKEKTPSDKYVDFILPVENLESYKFIKKNLNNLQEINVSEILSDYDTKNYIFLAINQNNKNFNIFMKGLVSEKEIVKSFNLTNEKNKVDEIILQIKEEIVEIIKSQNLIDIGTPAFLNIILDIKKQDDLYKIQNIIKKIDLVETFSVKELGKNFAKIKIMYYGKLNKISEKFRDQGLDIKIDNDQWKIKLL